MMMMTSTFPTSRSSSLTIRNGIKEMQGKKEVLINLEATLKRKINEFRELCLKEGELTGQLPIDYPLQPREPIPQVRRRITRSSGNIHEGTTKFLQPLTQIKTIQASNNFAVPNIPCNTGLFPSRPTSTNSSSSSTSTASSNTRSINHHHPHQEFSNDLHHNNRHFHLQHQQHQQQLQLQPQAQQQQHFLNSSSNIQSNSIRQSSSNGDLRHYNNHHHNNNHHFVNRSNNIVTDNNFSSGSNLAEKQSKPTMTTNDSNKTTVTNGHPAINPKNVVNIDGLTNIQSSYYEETKPFQMSDFYKYSSKHRQKISPTNSSSEVLEDTTMINRFDNNNQQVKTTRQHQEDVSKTKNSLKFASYDDQIQASVKLIEKSGQKFMEATAKAIAGNPSLAERLKQYSS